jgi:hypothetical protein
MRIIYLTIISCIVFLSCKKNTGDSQSFFNCEYQIQDSSVLANKLIGSWKWIKTQSGGTGEISQAKNLRILTFKADSTFSYIEGATILTQGKWSLKMIQNSSFWGLSIDPGSDYLGGIINVGWVFFCNNQMNQMELFYSYLDGPNFFFERMD